MNYKKPTNASRVDRSRAGRTPNESHDIWLKRARLDSSLKSIAFAASLGTLKRFADNAPGLIVIVLLAVVGWGAVATVMNYLDLPTVETSWLNQECVRVINGDGSEGSCDVLPTKYHHVWVE